MESSFISSNRAEDVVILENPEVVWSANSTKGQLHLWTRFKLTNLLEWLMTIATIEMLKISLRYWK